MNTYEDDKPIDLVLIQMPTSDPYHKFHVLCLS